MPRRIRDMAGERGRFANFLAVPLTVLNKLYEIKIHAEKLMIPILFHNPSKDLFESIVKYFLSAGYNFISLDDMMNHVLGSSLKESQKAICITIDDGWRDNLINVIPVIQKYRIPIAIYITTEPLESGCFWWEKVKKFSSYDSAKLKKISNKERSTIIAEIDYRYSDQYERNRSAITIEELRQISKISLVTIGSHTVNHPCMNRTSIEEDVFEIYESKKILENYIQQDVKHFAYPNGDFKASTIDVVKSAGYKSAAIVNYGFIRHGCNQYLLNRNAINELGSYRENLCHAYSSWRIVSSISSIINR